MVNADVRSILHEMQVLFVVSCNLACIKNPLLISEVHQTLKGAVKWGKSESCQSRAVGENLPHPPKDTLIPNGFRTFPTEQKYVLV